MLCAVALLIQQQRTQRILRIEKRKLKRKIKQLFFIQMDHPIKIKNLYILDLLTHVQRYFEK